MKSYNLPLFFSAAVILILQGCGSTKDTATSRGMQNLTARYNIIYNARILLDESRRDLEAAYTEDYGRVLPVYKEPSEAAAQSVSANLDSVILKANNIVNEKTYSKYVDDAYFLIGQANYYKARFFNAAEFFAYVYNTYPKSKALQEAALLWQARSLMQLNNMEKASRLIDSALKYVDFSKKTRKLSADVYATSAQYLISSGKEEQAVALLEKALKGKTNIQNRLRWTYILAQLQELTGQTGAAYKNYRKVVKSNAPFEMAFNAGLNRIRIEDQQSGSQIDRITRLRSLLKNEQNKDFIDQIYYRMGDIFLERKDVDQAIASYSAAVRHSTKNQNQKGLSYLKIADIYFRNGDYVAAKAYYDSTVTALSPSFPGYEVIRRKGSNLELLANRYRLIGREDTLQMLARLPEAERESRIGAMVREQLEKSQDLSLNNEAAGSMTAGIDNPGQVSTEGKFYFNNTTAIRQGIIDFKRRWGNRTLEDNWRRSGRTAAETILNQVDNPDAPVGTRINANASVLNPDDLKASYTDNLPLTENSMRLSDQRVADAYYDIATFYRDELRDNREAIRTFEELLKRVPEASNKLAVYYNLYRLYSQSDPQKSEEYKNLLLTKYSDSPFAKVIADPSYGSKTDEKEQAYNNAYNKIYDLYAEKKYAEVIPEVSNFETQFGNTPLSAQVSYLNALAIGHTQKLPVFESSLQHIVATYPDDKLTTPLVKQHLQYIRDNKALFDTRTTALMDYNPMEPVFVEPAPSQIATAPNPAGAAPDKDQAAAVREKPAEAGTKAEQKPMVTVSSAEATAKATEPAPRREAPPVQKTMPAYNLPDSAEYYFVVNVTDAASNLNSSRFGIGQFNRSRFAALSIKHQLKDVNSENQLIFVGPFNSLGSTREYERNILPLIREIMKIPAEKYNTFVITKDELDKFKNSSQINAYLDFYKNIQ